MEGISSRIDKSSREKRSEEFKRLRSDGGRLKRLLRGSDIVTSWRHSKEKSWEWWEKGRRPIASIIDRLADPKQQTVSVLDYGCANGLLLRSLQEWSEHEIEPYGFDKKPSRVSAARELFPGEGAHFSKNEKELGALPSEFDFVYWNLWDNWKLDSQKQVAHVQSLIQKTKIGGYLIVGLYDHSRTAREGKLRRLSELGLVPEGLEEGASGNETFAWFRRET